MKIILNMLISVYAFKICICKGFFCLKSKDKVQNKYDYNSVYDSREGSAGAIPTAIRKLSSLPRTLGATTLPLLYT